MRRTRSWANPVSAFAPTQISNLFAWYDASSLVGADGSRIASWPDKTGVGGNALTQGVGTAQPWLYTSTASRQMNGRPTAYADGSDTIAASYALSQPVTYVCAAANMAGAANGRVMDTLNATRQLIDFGAPAATSQIYAGTVQAGAVTPVGSHTMAVVFNGASSVLHVDGVNAAIGSPGANGNGQLTLFGSGQGTYLTGMIGEFLIYNRALTAPEISQLESYLRSKWATT